MLNELSNQALNGATIPPLDELLPSLRIEQNEVIAELALPHESGVFAGMMGVSGNRLDNKLVSDIYCQLVEVQEAHPTSDLSEVVRRTFGSVSTEPTEDSSRAAFVALSFLVVGDTAKAIAPQAAAFSQKCARLHPAILLHQRQDLVVKTNRKNPYGMAGNRAPSPVGRVPSARF